MARGAGPCSSARAEEDRAASKSTTSEVRIRLVGGRMGSSTANYTWDVWQGRVMGNTWRERSERVPSVEKGRIAAAVGVSERSSATLRMAS